MSFTSLTFLLFVLAVCLVYFIAPQKCKWVVLLLASWTFYALSGTYLIGFLLFTTTVTYISGRIMGGIVPSGHGEKREQALAVKRKKKAVLIVSLLINFGLLVLLKYNDYFPGLKEFLTGIGILLPLGISFYTFQSVGYLIDVFRGKYAPERNFFRFALFVSFFPQLVQGPISRFDDLAKQLYEPHRFSYERMVSGVELMLFGYFKKLVVADRINILVSFIFENYTERNGLYILFAGVLYCIQIYSDFSGGMDIAIGIAEIIGISLPQNFERPYFAKTLSEYWRRWHITLNQWLRDYLFYPISLSKLFVKLGQAGRKSNAVRRMPGEGRARLKAAENTAAAPAHDGATAETTAATAAGTSTATAAGASATTAAARGNRTSGEARRPREKKKLTFRQKFAKNFAIYFATLIVRIINAIWHGGAAKYYVNGIYHGVLIILSLQFEPFFKWIKKTLRINTECFSYRLFMMLRTFTLVLIGRIMLHAADFDQGVDMFRNMFKSFNPWIFFDGSMYADTGMTRNSYLVMLFAIAVLILTSILKERGMRLRAALARQNLVFRFVVLLALVFSIIIFGVYGKGYEAGMFIYQQF